jgi:hypothetical protein
MLVVAAAIAMPVSMVAIVGGAGVAGAKAAPPQALTCAVGGTVTFAGPGLSKNGSISASKTSTTTSVTNYTGTGCGAPNTQNITSKSTKCPKVAAPATGTCIKPNYLYDTTTSFITGGTTDITKALKKGIATTDHGQAVTLKVSGATVIDPGGACGVNESGFSVTGTVKKATNTWTLTLCLGTDTGTNTNNSFTADLLLANGGNTSIVIASTAVDPTDSMLVIS